MDELENAGDFVQMWLGHGLWRGDWGRCWVDCSPELQARLAGGFAASVLDGGWIGGGAAMDLLPSLLSDGPANPEWGAFSRRCVAELRQMVGGWHLSYREHEVAPGEVHRFVLVSDTPAVGEGGVEFRVRWDSARPLIDNYEVRKGDQWDQWLAMSEPIDPD